MLALQVVRAVVEVITIRLPWPKPPMMANHRYPHWAVKGKATKAVRQATALSARHVMRHIDWDTDWQPLAEPVTVELVWTVKDKRRRDSDGPEPTKKACLDGLVDAGLLSDDKSTVVTASWCRIEIGEIPGVRLEIRPVSVPLDADLTGPGGPSALERVTHTESPPIALRGSQTGRIGGKA